MVYAFGGAAEYKGKDLKAAHYHLVQNNGLNVDHFDMVAVHFQETLIELKIPQVSICSHVCCCPNYQVAILCALPDISGLANCVLNIVCLEFLLMWLLNLQ